MKRNKKIILSFLIVISILFISIIIYFENYYHSELISEEYLKNNDIVKINKIKNGYYFDGIGEDTALIFYPGAKVETESYMEIMNKLAQNGIDCFLVDMPLRFAFLGGNRANSILEEYSYQHWGISGHSLGGVVASNYAIKNSSKIDFLILFASYPTKEIDESIKLISIYGEKDGVLNMDSYNKSKEYWPKNSAEYKISGGNHANFGNYGNQKGDSIADISNDEQQSQVVKYITEFLKIDY